MPDVPNRTVSDVAPEAQARAGLYHVLGTVLAAPPDQALLNRLGTLDASNGTGDTPFASMWQQLRQSAAAADPQALEEAYFRLFIGLGRGELVPYASWYLHGALMERILAALREDLQRLGFVRNAGVAEPEDHAGALCQTMGMIITDPGLSLEQSAFFQAYIGAWMGRFFDDLAHADTVGFYRIVGRLGSFFVDLETQYFALQT